MPKPQALRNLFSLLLGLLALTGCIRPEGAAAQPPGQTPTQSATDWPSYNNTLTSARYSTLSQITPTNANTLTTHCTFNLGETANFQSGLVVVNGVIYLTTEQYTYAVDAATCALKWKVKYNFTPNAKGLQVNRGVAYADGRLFRGADDGYLYAHDAATGKQLWRTKVQVNVGETFPAAPIAWNNLVFIGNAGGDNAAVRGRMMAFDAATGKQVWNFDLVPTAGPGSETWPPETPDNPRTGGATWTSYTIDPTAGLLYIPVGNAAPDFDPAARPGLNLYTDSIVILDAKTGKLQKYYQITKNDFHDWDVAAAPPLFTTAGGKQLAAATGKDGFLHAIDLAAEKVLYEVPLTTISNTTAPLTTAGTHFCPGTQGGVEWNGPAWHPQLNTLFIGAVEACATIKLAQPITVTAPGAPFTNANPQEPFGTIDPQSQWRGWLTAVDADSGKIKWQYQAPTPLLAGVTATAGNVVFTGDLNGDFMVFDATTGKELYKNSTGQPIAGGVVTYASGNKQYIAVAAGMNSKTWKTTGQAKVLVYGLP